MNKRKKALPTSESINYLSHTNAFAPLASKKVTADRLLGHVFQHIATLTEPLADFEKQFRHLEQPRTEMPPSIPATRRTNPQA